LGIRFPSPTWAPNVPNNQGPQQVHLNGDGRDLGEGAEGRAGAPHGGQWSNAHFGDADVGTTRTGSEAAANGIYAFGGVPVRWKFQCCYSNCDVTLA
jgi:hypothetical protein